MTAVVGHLRRTDGIIISSMKRGHITAQFCRSRGSLENISLTDMAEWLKGLLWGVSRPSKIRGMSLCGVYTNG